MEQKQPFNLDKLLNVLLVLVVIFQLSFIVFLHLKASTYEKNADIAIPATMLDELGSARTDTDNILESIINRVETITNGTTSNEAVNTSGARSKPRNNKLPASNFIE